jgi:tetratricopeptide (TPR) repeat protein
MLVNIKLATTPRNDLNKSTLSIHFQYDFNICTNQENNIKNIVTSNLQHAMDDGWVSIPSIESYKSNNELQFFYPNKLNANSFYYDFFETRDFHVIRKLSDCYAVFGNRKARLNCPHNGNIARELVISSTVEVYDKMLYSQGESVLRENSQVSSNSVIRRIEGVLLMDASASDNKIICIMQQPPSISLSDDSGNSDGDNSTCHDRGFYTFVGHVYDISNNHSTNSGLTPVAIFDPPELLSEYLYSHDHLGYCPESRTFHLLLKEMTENEIKVTFRSFSLYECYVDRNNNNNNLSETTKDGSSISKKIYNTQQILMQTNEDYKHSYHIYENTKYSLVIFTSTHQRFNSIRKSKSIKRKIPQSIVYSIKTNKAIKVNGLLSFSNDQTRLIWITDPDLLHDTHTADTLLPNATLIRSIKCDQPHMNKYLPFDISAIIVLSLNTSRANTVLSKLIESRLQEEYNHDFIGHLIGYNTFEYIFYQNDINKYNDLFSTLLSIKNKSKKSIDNSDVLLNNINGSIICMNDILSTEENAILDLMKKIMNKFGLEINIEVMEIFRKNKLLILLIEKKKYKEALELSTSLYQDCNYNEVALEAQGNCLYALQKYEESATIYEQVFYLDEFNAKYASNAAAVYNHCNLLDKAMYFVNRAITINPSYPNAYRHMGLIYEKLNDLEASKSSLEKALALNPKYDAVNIDIQRIKQKLDVAALDINTV